MLTAGTTAAKSDLGKPHTTSRNWRQPVDPVVWKKREPTGKPIPGSYDWTVLTGTHKLKVLQRLPEMMNKILPDAVCGRIVHLWNVSEWS